MKFNRHSGKSNNNRQLIVFFRNGLPSVSKQPSIVFLWWKTILKITFSLKPLLFLAAHLLILWKLVICWPITTTNSTCSILKGHLFITFCLTTFRRCSFRKLEKILLLLKKIMNLAAVVAIRNKTKTMKNNNDVFHLIKLNHKIKK